MTTRCPGSEKDDVVDGPRESLICHYQLAIDCSASVQYDNLVMAFKRSGRRRWQTTAQAWKYGGKAGSRLSPNEDALGIVTYVQDAVLYSTRERDTFVSTTATEFRALLPDFVLLACRIGIATSSNLKRQQDA